MQKQLEAIIALAPTKARVPQTHFEPSSIDGISLATTVPNGNNTNAMVQENATSNIVPSTVQTARNNTPAPPVASTLPDVPVAPPVPQLRNPTIPSRIRTEHTNAQDDSSVASFQSLQQGYQDMKINLTTFEEEWLQNDTPKA